MPGSFSWEGFDALSAKLRKLGDPDAEPLMIGWRRVIEDDNRRGVLAGTDKDDNPAPPLRYRPVAGKGKRATKQQRNNNKPGHFAGFGPHTAGLHNNLTWAEYRKLNGPRLAPRGANSRVITNLFTGHGRDPADQYTWFAVGAWREVVTPGGKPFLHYHFEGLGRNPRYDLCGVRAWGQRQAADLLHNWVHSLLV